MINTMDKAFIVVGCLGFGFAIASLAFFIIGGVLMFYIKHSGG